MHKVPRDRKYGAMKDLEVGEIEVSERSLDGGGRSDGCLAELGWISMSLDGKHTLEHPHLSRDK